MDNLKKLFIKFIEKTPSFGKSFICLDDKTNKEIIKKLKINFYKVPSGEINKKLYY